MKTAFTDIVEVVFEGRNKSYGAFFLRKINNIILLCSLLMGLCVVTGATIIPFIFFREANLSKVEISVGAEFANMEAPGTEEEVAPPPPPPPPPPEALEQKVRFTAPVVTSDTVEDTGMLNQDDLNQQSTNTELILPTESELIESEIVPEVVENKTIEQVAPPFCIVEVMPTFDGGESAMYDFLNENIVYPAVAKETNVSGTVIVTFVVEKDGSITGIKVLKDIGGGCGDEAIRVITAMPKWIPGKQNGVPVRVQFSLPIKFILL